ncbi:Diaminobutyrate decarboxylase [Flagellimonas maritima]|uniref:Diaminobutyrate decarboxylase n=1 Tax=Flagellimonas maritima TaxID=1383885 RepID=A0A2Z4LN07_9FLAO|nr:aminotransferase class I/II-fold pyridoxal phosphate-dependent enzyme [Allomuricauda aurantiaca]AWX43120.1 Diaminobutyrate decarboxylase [Allomuricauda aurantiaca]
MDNKILSSLYAQDNFRRLGKQLIDVLTDHIQNTTQEINKKTIQWNEPENELDFWKDFFENGTDDDFFNQILKRTTHTHNPKYVGHQVGVTAPITVFTGMLSNLLNNGMAVYEMGMAPNAIERIVIEKLCETIGYNSKSGGFLTSGGTLANLTALLSARKAKVEHDIWNEGHNEPLGIMVCEEAHYCVDRAAKIMGLGEKGIIKIPADENFAMDIQQLETYYQESISKGLKIFAIVGSAPSTATGAYDNLEAINKFAQMYNLWFHVDGAHGGAAIFSEKYKYLLKGAEKADSMVIDGHKMMMMPTITTALLFKNKNHSNHTFSQKADYLLNDTEEDEWYNSGRRTFECTKNMMCMHWFILLKMYGQKAFNVYVTRQYDLARDFAKIISKEPNFEIATEPMSNILCFRYLKDNLSLEELNHLNQSIRRQLLEDGEFYLVQTKLNGVHYLRTTLMNPFTTIDHLKLLLEKIKKGIAELLSKKD